MVKPAQNKPRTIGHWFIREDGKRPRNTQCLLFVCNKSTSVQIQWSNGTNTMKWVNCKVKMHEKYIKH